MRYVVVSGEHANKATDAIAALEKSVNAAIREGATVSGGVSVVHGPSSRNFGMPGYQAFQAVIYLN